MSNASPALTHHLAIDVEGIFRLAGAERRIKELMAVFNMPERYGRGLDWTGYTVHDAANLLRRYLNQLPEPIVPLAMYTRFREPLKHHQAEAVGPMEQQQEAHGDFDSEATIQIFQQLITELPPLNRQLLLYILDLLAVFSSKSDVNRMTAPNLSAIFQPGILRHPDHDLMPSEYRLSQDVIIFLVEHQDHFVVGMVGSAVDEKTVQDMQAAPKTTATPTTPKNRTQQLIGRSTSSASAGSDQMRRFGDIRRNASTNSRGSRQSQHTPSPVTPPTGSPFMPGSRGSGVYRSNTLPSKKSPSPALSASERFQRFQPSQPLPSANVATATVPSPLLGATDKTAASSSSERLGVHHWTPQSAKFTSSPHRSPLLKPWAAVSGRSSSQDRQLAAGELLSPEQDSASGRASPLGTPSRERGISSLWKQSPGSDTERRDGRPRNKLQKKRPPGEISAQGSQQNLAAGEEISNKPASPALSPAIVEGQAPALNAVRHEDPPVRPEMSTTNSFQTAREQPGSPPQASPPSGLERDFSAATLRPGDMALKDLPQRHSGSTMKAREPSPRGSTRSHSTGAEASSQSTGDDGDAVEVAQREKRHHRWRISMSKKKADERNNSDVAPVNANLGSALDADRSTSSVGSHRMPRKSYTDDSYHSDTARAPSSSEAEERATSPRRGPIGWFRGKMQDRQDRRDEKERAKSPTPRAAPSDLSASSQSLGGIVVGEAPASSQQHQFHAIPPAAQILTESSVQQPIQPTVQALTQELQGLSITAVQPTTPVVQSVPAQITTQELTSAEGMTSAGSLSDIAETETPSVSQQVNSSPGGATMAQDVMDVAATQPEQEHRYE